LFAQSVEKSNQAELAINNHKNEYIFFDGLRRIQFSKNFPFN